MINNTVRFNGIYGTAYKHGLVKREIPIELDSPSAELSLEAEKPGKISIKSRNGTMGRYDNFEKGKFFDEVRIDTVNERSEIDLTGYSKVKIDNMSENSSLTLRNNAEANISKFKDRAKLFIHGCSSLLLKSIEGGQMYNSGKIKVESGDRSIEILSSNTWDLPLSNFNKDVGIESIPVLKELR